MKAKLLILLTLMSFSVSAQQVQQYSGEFNNGSTNKGMATYSCYLKNGDKIKQGTFSYSNNVKTDEGYANTKITGSFKDGFKDGTWSYIVEYKDFNTGAGNFWVTGTTKMTANYSNGIPDGPWNFNRNSKSRSKKFTNYGYDWTTYDEPINETVQATYKKGILKGNFEMRNVIMNQFENIKGSLDENGYCIGSWIFESNSKEMSMEFYKNVEIDFIIRNKNSGKVEQKSNYSPEEVSSLKSFADGKIHASSLASNYRIKIDTANWIESRFITFQSTFYSELFLEKYIGGDKTYTDENYKFYQTKRGLYRIFGDTKSMAIINLTDISEYRNAINKLESYPKGALNDLQAIKSQYGDNLTQADLKTINDNIALSKDKVKAEDNSRNNENEIRETKNNISNLVNETSNELRVANQKNKAFIESEYFQEYLKISGIQGDYVKIRDVKSDFSKSYDQGINYVINYLDNQLQLAGIDKSIRIGQTQDNPDKSLDELKSIESELNKNKEQLSQIISTYKSIYENEFKIFISYNEYNKMKSSISGVETYNLIKEPIFQSYKLVFESDIKRLNEVKSIDDKLGIAKSIEKLSEKVLKLADLDSKSIEKELKKTSDIETIREIILK